MHIRHIGDQHALAGLAFLRYNDPRGRRLCLVVPIAVDLALLGFFKYANFAASTVRDVASVFGWQVNVPYVNVILPVGISFYTFHTITYIVDSYRGTIRPTRNLFEFAAYVSDTAVPAGLNGYVAFVWDWVDENLMTEQDGRVLNAYGRLIAEEVFARHGSRSVEAQRSEGRT